MSARPSGDSPGRPKQRTKFGRIVLLSVVLPPTIIVSVCLLLAYHIWASHRLMDSRFVSVAASPTRAQSYVIFSPHCDDETLGAGGLIYRARHIGCPVRVVFFTNGDGFRISAAKVLNKITVQPADFVRYGYDRQTEVHAAMDVLGVRRDQTVFLGYPDRGLLPMLTEFWSPSALYRSYYTHDDHSPYSDAPTPNAGYCGQNVLHDVEAQLEIAKPTDVYVTHPNDDHPDHAAAGAFVKIALDDLQRKGEVWAKRARLHYYLVHHGDWPVPQGLNENDPLAPPADMTGADTVWSKLPLTQHEVQRKYAAIKRYQSQTEITGRFLYSFARSNELFGRVGRGVAAELPMVPTGSIRMTGKASEWAGIAPIVRDPVGQSVLRDVQGGGDIQTIYAARDSRALFIRVDMHRNISDNIRYGLVIRGLTLEGAQPQSIQLSGLPPAEGVLTPLAEPSGAQVIRRDRSLEYRIPTTAVGLGSNPIWGEVYILADTRIAHMPIDRSGLRGVLVRQPISELASAGIPAASTRRSMRPSIASDASGGR
jgi:LmbE family N-acetylglucosaminyl deacetylase